MNGPNNAAMADAASFFALFARSSWTSCHLKTADIEVFVSRKAGVANPMMGAAPEPATVKPRTLCTPQLGTLVALADIGTVLTAGQSYGRIELLDETIELIAQEGGTVADRLIPIGALAEFDQPLLVLH